MRIQGSTTAISALAAILCLPGVAKSGNDAIMRQIVKDWQARRDLASTVRYEVEGKAVFPKGRYTERLRDMGYLPADSKEEVPPQDQSTELRVNWLLAFSKNWVRKEMLSSVFLVDDRTFAPTYQLELFDGKELKLYQPREKNTSKVYKPSEIQPDLWLQTKRFEGVLFGGLDRPVFLAHGLVPTSEASPAPGGMEIPLTLDGASYQGPAIHRGRDCALLRITKKSGGTYDVWVDTARQSAVVRWVQSIRGTPLFSLNIDYTQHGAAWLPSGWQLDQFDPEEKRLMLHQNVKVTNLELNESVQLSDFQIQPVPGQVVGKAGTGMSYRVSEDGSLQEIVGGGEAGPRRWLLFGLIALLALAGLGALAFRRWKKRTA